MNVKDSIESILKQSPEYRTNFNQYSKVTMAALKLPFDAPIFDKIRKNMLANIWAKDESKRKRRIIMVVEVLLDEKK